jgi:predicted transcriptional regulator
MENDNMFLKIENFSNITTNPNTVKIFLIIAKNKVMHFDQIIDEANLSYKDVIDSTDKLEKGNFIIRNPSPTSQKFKLGFNGQLFAEQLKMNYPEIQNLLGKESLIEPLKS